MTEEILLTSDEYEEIYGKPSASRKESLLRDAIEACCGDRQLNYGAPEQNFERIAELWKAWFDVRKAYDPLQPWEVSVLLILMKLARQPIPFPSRLLARHC